MSSLLQRLLNSNGAANGHHELIDQPETTYAGTPIPPIRLGLPKEIDSVCPECMEIIKATLYPDGGKVWIRKTCKEHGDFKDIFYGDEALYHRSEKFWYGDGRGIEDPSIPNATVCPKQCGLCNMHTSHSGLPIVDLTNRCNMTCPVCFANANAAGYLYEPSFEEITRMLETLANQKPVKCIGVQFSGGEPTIRPDFLDIVKKAREFDLDYIQVNTNGIKMSEIEFAQAAKDAGVENLYLQFDGLSDDVYMKTRATPMHEIKMKAIENCRKVRIGIVLVVTLVKGFNDHQVGDIVRFAVRNSDIISGIAFQPVSFVGRFSQKHRLEKRYTLADLAFDIERQTGYIQAMRDWFPIEATSALSRLATAMSGRPRYTVTLHPHCSQGSYLFVGENFDVKPVSEFVDVENFFADLIRIAKKMKPSEFGLLSKVKAFYKLKKHYRPEAAPKGLTFEKFLKSLEGYQDRNLRQVFADDEVRKERSQRHIFLAGMHFMDAYNFSIERVMRCVVHYPDPDGNLYPFCAYNGAPVYRSRVESRFKLTPAQIKEKIIAEGRPKELERIAKKMGV